MRNTSYPVVKVESLPSKISWLQQSTAFYKSKNKEQVSNLLSKLLSWL